MTHDERTQHDARLLDAQRLHLMAPEKRKAYLELLHVHTLMGYDLTLKMLSNRGYAARKEHLQDVLNSLSSRQEKLLRLLENT